MPLSGNPFFLSEVAGGGQGAANARIVQPEPAAGNFITRADFGTDGTTRWYRLTPAATVGPAGGDPAASPPTAGDNIGWNISQVDMDRPSGRPRKMFAGTITANVSAQWSNVDALAAADTYKIRAHVFKRSAVGALSLLGTGEVSVPSADVGVVAKHLSFTVSVVQTLFQTGETLHAEYWLRGRGVAVVGQTFQFRTGNSGADPDVKLTLPGAGLVHETELTDVTRDSAGGPLGGATVKIFLQSNDTRQNEQISTATGVYSWLRDSTDTNQYYVVAYKADVPEIHGVSDRGLVPAE